MKVLQKFQKHHVFWTPVFFLELRRASLKFEEFIYGGCRKLSAFTFKMRLTAKYVVKRALIQVTRLKGTKNIKFYVLTPISHGITVKELKLETAFSSKPL